MTRKSKKFANAVKNVFPSAYKSQPIMQRKIRYKASSSITKDGITRGCLECFMITRSATASTTEALTPIRAVLLRSIEIWGVDSSSATAMTTIALEWEGSLSPNLEISATGNSQHPAHIKAKAYRDWDHKVIHASDTTVIVKPLFCLGVRKTRKRQRDKSHKSEPEYGNT